jgi:N-acetylglucosamine-6-phosphate deacetylase
MTLKAIFGGSIHDGHRFVDADVLLMHDGVPKTYIKAADIPEEAHRIDLAGGYALPGFVDLQVNGAGGVMFNSDPSVEALKTMSSALRSVGTTQFLATLISDTPSATSAAIEAVAQDVDGVVGLHLEGPHLSAAKKGAHSQNLIRPMEDVDLAILLAASKRIANLMVTVAPESVSCSQISALSDAGILVSLGHTNADFETCAAAMDAGAGCTTHLYNAMSQMSARAPGLVGATLSRDGQKAGVIADGIHVHPAAIKAAMSDDMFLVTDAMATIGSEISEFQLDGRTIRKDGNRLTLEDGTLAGAHLDFPKALRVMVEEVGVSVETAISMATSRPAAMLKGNLGRIELGVPCDLVILDDALSNPLCDPYI